MKGASECFQLLHHAYVLGAEKAIFLVGSNVHLLYGILVSFPRDLLLAYGCAFKSIYSTGAYNSNHDISDERMLTAQQSLRQWKRLTVAVGKPIGIPVDMDSLL